MMLDNPSLESLLTIVCASLVVVFAADVVARRVFGVDKELWNRLASCMHSSIVVACSTAYLIDLNGFTFLGLYGHAISIAYMIWDMKSMVDIEYTPLAPLIIHHLITINAEVYVLFNPEYVWFGCILLSTEITVPVNTLKFFLESREPGLATGKAWTWQYALVRWMLLLVWIAARLLIFIPFHMALYDRWSSMSLAGRCVGVIGPFLLIFNLEALRIMVSKGFPWCGIKTKGA